MSCFFRGRSAIYIAVEVLMAGKRQHFIPQFLQRGFTSHLVKGESFTWVYRKDREPFNANIVNVGVETLFYSRNEDEEIDKAITSLENDLSKSIQLLRKNDSDELRNIERISNLFAHLEVRTRHIRQAFLESAGSLFQYLTELVTNENTFAQLIIRVFV